MKINNKSALRIEVYNSIRRTIYMFMFLTFYYYFFMRGKVRCIKMYNPLQKRILGMNNHICAFSGKFVVLSF